MFCRLESSPLPKSPALRHPARPGTRLCQGDGVYVPLVIHSHYQRLPGLFPQPDQRVDRLEVALVGPQRIVVQPGHFTRQVAVGRWRIQAEARGVHAGEHYQDNVEALGLALAQQPQRRGRIEAAGQFPQRIAKPNTGAPR